MGGVDPTHPKENDGVRNFHAVDLSFCAPRVISIAIRETFRSSCVHWIRSGKIKYVPMMSNESTTSIPMSLQCEWLNIATVCYSHPQEWHEIHRSGMKMRCRKLDLHIGSTYISNLSISWRVHWTGEAKPLWMKSTYEIKCQTVKQMKHSKK